MEITTVDGREHIELRKPCLVVVNSKYTEHDERLNPKFKKGEWVTGNKAHIDFFVFIPTRITELIEHYLNKDHYLEAKPKNGARVLIPMLDRQLTPAHNKRAVRYIIKKYFAEIDKSDLSPYRLRNYGNNLLNRIKADDEQLKEQLMGHKGDISSVYQFRSISEEDETRYRMIYNKVDIYIDENVFGTLTETDRKIADAVDNIALIQGVDPEQLKKIRAILDNGKMSLTQYHDRIGAVIKKVSTERLEAKIEEIVSRRITLALEHQNGGDPQ